MRKLTILTSITLICSMAGCAVQRYPANTQGQYPTQYPNQNQYQQYPTQYPGYGQNQAPYPNQYQNQNAYVDTALIVGIREVNVGSGGSSGAGAAVGALIGGVLGHQVGKGSGRDLATIGGAIAGGVLGNEMERSSTPKNKLELTVRLQNGEQRTLLVEPNNYYRMGDRVRVSFQNGQLALAP
ncbi:glycine zipper 2TM domain-containing protein [Undibacterium sp. Ji49W]|uniref:glycine zipper 2TM domain-containing protein n=1 Tax=Undibacterium sp. Ji49W TaxID=3413040 RepID=UPI003BF21956